MNLDAESYKAYYTELTMAGMSEVAIDGIVTHYIEISSGLVDLSVGDAIHKIDTFIQRQIVLGVSPEQITEMIINDLTGDVNIFAGLQTDLEKNAREMISNPQKDIPEYDAEEEYTAISVGDDQVCDFCISFHNESHTITDWYDIAGGIPNTWPSYCNIWNPDSCRCDLVLTRIVKKDPVEKPIILKEA